MPRKEFIERHRKMGLCTRCMRPPVPGFSTCEFHQRSSREQHQSYKGTGLCHNCGKTARLNKGRCDRCAVTNSTVYKNFSLEEQAKVLAAFIWFDGRCAICGRSDPDPGGRRGWNIDHDHLTNTFRDFLCARCNKGLAFFEDNSEVMLRAVEYLRRHNGGDPRNTGINVGTNNN
jgi:hypothetical protein